MRDRASVNNVAICTLSIVFSKVLDIGCFSHTLDHVGEHMKTPVLVEFMKGWIGLFSTSPKARLAWNSLAGVPVPGYSDTRWWSRWEVMNHLLKSFGDVSSFLDKADLPSSKLKLQEILSDPPKNRKLHMELAITVDAMELFVKSTYRLEGDGPLMLKAYEEIATLSAWILNQHYPNTKAAAKTLTTTPAQQRQLLDYAESCVEPAYKYFEDKIEGDLKPIVQVFKYARFFDPSKIGELKPSSNDIDDLKVFLSSIRVTSWKD